VRNGYAVVELARDGVAASMKAKTKKEITKIDNNEYLFILKNSPMMFYVSYFSFI
jgi:hypothetical protein